MINRQGQIVCSNCRTASAGDGYLESSSHAIDAGWRTIADQFYGQISLDHFCPNCMEAAEARAKRSEENEPYRDYPFPEDKK